MAMLSRAFPIILLCFRIPASWLNSHVTVSCVLYHYRSLKDGDTGTEGFLLRTMGSVAPVPVFTLGHQPHEVSAHLKYELSKLRYSICARYT